MDSDFEKLPSFLRKGAALGKVETLESLITQGLIQTSDWTRAGRMYASGAAYCARQTYLYSTFKGESVITPSSASYMTLGSAIEDIVMTGLFNSHALLFKQYRLPDMGLNMGGKIDGIVFVDGKIRGLEVKSCGELPNKPKPDHRAQALVYSATTGVDFSVLYFSRSVADYKGNLKMRNLPLNATKEDLTAAMYVVCYSKLAIDAGVLPSKPAFESASACGFCNYIDNCWKGVPFSVPPVTPELHLHFVHEAGKMATNLMTDEVVEERRNGMLKHIQENGGEDAQRILAGSWRALV